MAAACLPDRVGVGGEHSNKAPRVTITHSQGPQGVHAKWGVAGYRKCLACVFEHPLAPTFSTPWCLWEQGRPVFRAEWPYALRAGWVAVTQPWSARWGPRQGHATATPVCAVNYRIPPPPRASVTVLTTALLRGAHGKVWALECPRVAALSPEPGEWVLVPPSHGEVGGPGEFSHFLGSPGRATWRGDPTPQAI